jgi:hypothetical protein
VERLNKDLPVRIENRPLQISPPYWNIQMKASEALNGTSIPLPNTGRVRLLPPACF